MYVCNVRNACMYVCMFVCICNYVRMYSQFMPRYNTCLNFSSRMQTVFCNGNIGIQRSFMIFLPIDAAVYSAFGIWYLV